MATQSPKRRAVTPYHTADPSRRRHNMQSPRKAQILQCFKYLSAHDLDYVSFLSLSSIVVLVCFCHVCGFLVIAIMYEGYGEEDWLHLYENVCLGLYALKLLTQLC
jgi:hypothetical protein